MELEGILQHKKISRVSNHQPSCKACDLKKITCMLIHTGIMLANILQLKKPENLDSEQNQDLLPERDHTPNTLQVAKKLRLVGQVPIEKQIILLLKEQDYKVTLNYIFMYLLISVSFIYNQRVFLLKLMGTNTEPHNCKICRG